jgi:hypothetical protein
MAAKNANIIALSYRKLVNMPPSSTLHCTGVMLPEITDRAIVWCMIDV